MKPVDFIVLGIIALMIIGAVILSKRTKSCCSSRGCSSCNSCPGNCNCKGYTKDTSS